MSDEFQSALTEGTCVHVCVDLQNMFARETGWHTPWLARILPNAVRLARARPDDTLFTRFIPAARPGDGRGTWARYYERWADMTLERLAPDMVDLVPELAALARPGQVVDKTVYSPWQEAALEDALWARGADTLIVSGRETDVCVLATVLGAVDRGYRIVVVEDALCSSSDHTHDAMLTLYRERYGQQISVMATDDVLRAWARPATRPVPA